MNRTLLYAAIGLAAGAGAAWALAPRLPKIISPEEARRMLGLAANLVLHSPQATPRRTRQVRAAAVKTGSRRTSRPRKLAA